ncbi:MAG: response regulator [Cyanophyceae cyanobacterium]
MSISREDRPPTVLIVDDDRATQALLTLAMEEEGYETVGAQNGEQAIEEFNRLVPNLVLLDAMMPEMDGFTCCERLRSLPEGKTVPILIITVLDDQESVDRAFAAGTTDYITKPIYWPVLCQRVRRLVQAGETDQQLAMVSANLQQAEAWAGVVTATLGCGDNSETATLEDRLLGVLAIARETLGGDRAGLWLGGTKTWLECQGDDVDPVDAAAGEVLEEYVQGQSSLASTVIKTSEDWSPLGAVFRSAWGMVVPLRGDRGILGGLIVGRSQDQPWSDQDQQRWQQLGQLLGLVLSSKGRGDSRV